MYVFNYDSTSAIIPRKCEVFLRVFTSYGFTVIFTGMIKRKRFSLFVQVQQMTENTTDIYLVGCELDPSLWYKWNGKRSDSAVWQTSLNNRQYISEMTQRRYKYGRLYMYNYYGPT